MTGQSTNPSTTQNPTPSTNSLVSVTSVPSSTSTAPISTHVQQTWGTTTHHQQNAPVADTESSIIDELSVLTSDEEFMMSPSWNPAVLPETSMPAPSLPPEQLSIHTAEPQVSQTIASVPQHSLQQQSTVEPQLLQQFTMPVSHLSQQSTTPPPQPLLRHFTPIPQPLLPVVQQSALVSQPPLQESTPVPQPSLQQSTEEPQLLHQFTHLSQQSNASEPPQPAASTQPSVTQPPFSTPPKLLPVERVMMDYPGTDEASLRRLTTALAREAIFGRDALCRSSLSGKNNTGSLEKHKLEYIKAVVKSRVPNMPNITFEGIWSKCRASLSKSCQTLRTSAKKKIFS